MVKLKAYSSYPGEQSLKNNILILLSTYHITNEIEYNNILCSLMLW